MTATVASRKRRGSQTQAVVATWFAEHGWPYAESAGAGRPGCDLTGVPGLAIEVKGRRGFSPLAWIRQARRTPGVPFVVHRPDGMGPATVADWPVTMRLEDLTVLLRAAGYGSDPARPSDGPEPVQGSPSTGQPGFVALAGAPASASGIPAPTVTP